LAQCQLLWTWADLPVCAATHLSALASDEAREHVESLADPGAVVVVLTVPFERCLLTSHVLWDAVVLRGRYLARDMTMPSPSTPATAQTPLVP